VRLRFAAAVEGPAEESEEVVFEPIGEPVVPEEVAFPPAPDRTEPEPPFDALPADAALDAREPARDAAEAPLDAEALTDLLRLRTRPLPAPPRPAAAAPAPAAPPRPAPSRPAAPPPARAGAARTALRPLAWPRVTAANYPPAALRQGVQGTVTVEITVGTDGTVVAARVVSSSGSAVLDDDAVVRARQFRFAPIDRPLRANVPIRYRIV
jgi:protein TonB